MQTIEPITATAIETTRDTLILVLPARRVRIPWERCSKKLASATELQRSTAELSPGGYGIHTSARRGPVHQRASPRHSKKLETLNCGKVADFKRTLGGGFRPRPARSFD